jgi:hypothetical protein
MVNIMNRETNTKESSVLKSEETLKETTKQTVAETENENEKGMETVKEDSLKVVEKDKNIASIEKKKLTKKAKTIILILALIVIGTATFLYLNSKSNKSTNLDPKKAFLSKPDNQLTEIEKISKQLSSEYFEGTCSDESAQKGKPNYSKIPYGKELDKLATETFKDDKMDARKESLNTRAYNIASNPEKLEGIKWLRYFDPDVNGNYYANDVATGRKTKIGMLELDETVIIYRDISGPDSGIFTQTAIANYVTLNNKTDEVFTLWESKSRNKNFSETTKNYNLISRKYWAGVNITVNYVTNLTIEQGWDKEISFYPFKNFITYEQLPSNIKAIMKNTYLQKKYDETKKVNKVNIVNVDLPIFSYFGYNDNFPYNEANIDKSVIIANMQYDNPDIFLGDVNNAKSQGGLDVIKSCEWYDLVNEGIDMFTGNKTIEERDNAYVKIEKDKEDKMVNLIRKQAIIVCANKLRYNCEYDPQTVSREILLKENFFENKYDGRGDDIDTFQEIEKNYRDQITSANAKYDEKIKEEGNRIANSKAFKSIPNYVKRKIPEWFKK